MKRENFGDCYDEGSFGVYCWVRGKCVKKNEVIIIRSRGGTLTEVRIIPHNRKQGKAKFLSDDIVEGSMQTKSIPSRYNQLIEFLEKNGKLQELEQMIKFIFR